MSGVSEWSEWSSPFSYTMAVPRRDSLQASLPQPLQCDSHAVRPLSLQITMAAAQRQASQTTSMQHLQGDSHAAQTLVLQITMAPVHRHTSQTSFTRKTASGTSGDNARRSPFWRAWVLRLPRRQPAAPAATTRAAAPSGGSGYCACHEEDSQRHQRRQRAPQPLLEALGTAPASKTASGTQRHQRRSSFFCIGVCCFCIGVFVLASWAVCSSMCLCVFLLFGWWVGGCSSMRLCVFLLFGWWVGGCSSDCVLLLFGWWVGGWVGGWAGGPPCAEKGDLAIAGWWQPRNSEQKPSKLGWKATCAFCIVCKKE